MIVAAVIGGNAGRGLSHFLVTAISTARENSMTALQASESFQKLRSQAGQIETAALDELFDSLPPIDCQSILGQWKGGGFDTGHKGMASLKAIKWYGKTFNSRLDAKPLICYDEQGNLHSSQAMKGEASLWMIEFRGKVSAAMVYDGVAIVDHFRQVDDRTLLGIMDGKASVLDNGKHFYFYLERV